MTSPDPTPRQSRGESMLAFSIMFFAGALLCFLLGWADGVRHGKTFLHIPETGSFLVATADLRSIGDRLPRLVARHEAWLTISGPGFAGCAILFQPGDIAPEHPEFPPRSARPGGRPQPCRMGLQCPQKCARACDRGSSAENFLFWPNEKLRVRLESVQARDRGAVANQA